MDPNGEHVSFVKAVIDFDGALLEVISVEANSSNISDNRVTAIFMPNYGNTDARIIGGITFAFKSGVPPDTTSHLAWNEASTARSIDAAFGEDVLRRMSGLTVTAR
jgi:hypothetical protein